MFRIERALLLPVLLLLACSAPSPEVRLDPRRPRLDVPLLAVRFGDPSARHWLRHGWTEPEGQETANPWIWTNQIQATCLIPWGEPAEVEASLIARRPPGTQEPHPEVALRIRKVEVYRFRPSSRWEKERFTLPEGILRPGMNRLIFVCSRLVPAEESGASRELGVALRELRLGTPLPTVPGTRPGQLALPTGARATWAFPEPPGTLRLRLESPTGKRRIRAWWSDDQGLLEDPRHLEVDGSVDMSIPAPAAAGPVTLCLAAKPDASPGWLLVEAWGPPDHTPGEARATPVTHPVEPSPNLLLLVADATNSSFLGAWGDPLAQTPVLDRAARLGIQFSAAETNAPFTLASVGSYLTGLFPLRHGVTTNQVRLAPLIPTVSKLLRRGGYTTALVTSMPYASSVAGYHRGFDELLEIFRSGEEGPRMIGVGASQGEDWVTATRGLLDRLGRGPWFVYAHMREPHSPYDPRPPRGRIRSRGPAPTLTDHELIMAWDPAGSTPEVVQALRRLYAGNVYEADEFLGQVLRHLRELDLASNTWIFLTSDHGEGFAEHGKLRHGSRLHAEMLSVPLVVIPPDRRGARIVSRSVCLADLAPTLCRLAGLEPPPDSDGRPLPGLGLSTSDDRSHPIYALTYQENGSRQERVVLESIRLGRYRGIYDPWTEGWSLYDLESDPGERVNLAAELPATRELLVHHWRAIHRRPPPAQAEVAPVMDEKVRRELETLGYLD